MSSGRFSISILTLNAYIEMTEQYFGIILRQWVQTIIKLLFDFAIFLLAWDVYVDKPYIIFDAKRTKFFGYTFQFDNIRFKVPIHDESDFKLMILREMLSIISPLQSVAWTARTLSLYLLTWLFDSTRHV